ncbi:MAG: S1 RNA-binding domain-containing protein [Pirellulales bacterium]
MASDSTDTDPTQVSSNPPADAQSARPSERIRIGSQRNSIYRTGGGFLAAEEEAADVAPLPATEEELKPKPQPIAPVAAPTSAPESEKPPRREPAKHYPPPNIRDNLTPEMEAEYMEALGDLSVDALLNSGDDSGIAQELAPETRITGRVAKIYLDDVFVDMPGHSQGAVPKRQFETLPTVGSDIELLVVKFDADEGLYELTLPTAAVSIGNWEDAREGQIVDVTVTGANKGGLECQVAGIRGFIPMGQVSVYRVENPEEFVGQRLACVVTEANRDRQNLVLSHRAVMERERNALREKMMEELAPGQLREGVVRSMKDFGAFVDLGGLDGLIHISQLSWDRVNHPNEVLTVGQKVKVRVDKFDKDSGKVSLSYREVGDNPWNNVESKYYVGARVNGVVSRLMEFGAFVKLEPGVEGLIHISELAHGRVFRTGDVVSEGQELEVKVMSVDKEKQRIGLSLKALQARPEKPGEKRVEDEDMPLPADAPKPPRKKQTNLKGGIGGPSGGDKFGLNW